MTVLVTGAGGFIGRHLCAALAAGGVELAAIGSAASAARCEVDAFFEVDGVPDARTLAELLDRVRPEQVYHLAGTARASSADVLYAVNLLYGVRLLEACAALSEPPRVIFAGSAAEYGPAPGPAHRFSESDPTRPLNTYGASKLAQTLHACAQGRVPIVVARMFNPVGEGMPVSTALGRFLDQIACMPPDGGVIECGPLHALRDVSDVKDVARALVSLGRAPSASGVYNLCSGEPTRMSELADALSAVAPFPLTFRVRGGDGGVDRAIGNPERLHRLGIVLRKVEPMRVLPRMLVHAGVST